MLFILAWLLEQAVAIDATNSNSDCLEALQVPSHTATRALSLKSGTEQLFHKIDNGKSNDYLP